MIQVETKLNVADNSGAREAKCIRVLGGTRRRYASVGDIIVVAVNNIIPSSDLKKGAVSKALIVLTALIYVLTTTLVCFLITLENCAAAAYLVLLHVSYVVLI